MHCVCVALSVCVAALACDWRVRCGCYLWLWPLQSRISGVAFLTVSLAYTTVLRSVLGRFALYFSVLDLRCLSNKHVIRRTQHTFRHKSMISAKVKRAYIKYLNSCTSVEVVEYVKPEEGARVYLRY